jgi:hypothetical protein
MSLSSGCPSLLGEEERERERESRYVGRGREREEGREIIRTNQPFASTIASLCCARNDLGERPWQRRGEGEKELNLVMVLITARGEKGRPWEGKEIELSLFPYSPLHP